MFGKEIIIHTSTLQGVKVKNTTFKSRACDYHWAPNFKLQEYDTLTLTWCRSIKQPIPETVKYVVINGRLENA